MQVSISAAHLRAASFCSGDADVRYYLNGVLAEIRPTETRLVSTNGSVIAVLRDQVTSGEQPDMPDVIIPNATVKMALSTKSAALSLAFEEGRWALAGISFSPVDGKFPEYRRAIPGTHSGEAGQFDQELLARFTKVGKALGVRTSLVLRHNGTGTAQVSFVGREEEFVGAISPFDHFKQEPDKGLIRWGSEYPARLDLDLA